MKRYIYITGILSANLMFFGAMFKIMHFPGAGILLALSISILCFLFLPFALYNTYTNSSPQRYKLLYIVTYFVFAFVFIGALFKVMHWPGAGWFMIFGIPLPMVVFLPVYLIQTRKDKKYSMINFMGIMFGLTFLTVFSAMLSINANANILVDIENQFKKNKHKSKIISNTRSFDSNELKAKARELCNYINELQDTLLVASGNLTGNFQTSNIIHLDDKKATSSLLFNNYEEDPIILLKDKIMEFKNAIATSDYSSPELIILSDNLLYTKDKYGENSIYRWDQYYFRDYSLIVVLEGLSRLERNILFIESEL